MWKRTIEGKELHFVLAGINNQNFLMRDEETGTWWQQVTGKAIFGPLRGWELEPMPSDELTFRLWKQESPGGDVLATVAQFASRYAHKDWESEIALVPVAGQPSSHVLKPRDIVYGIELGSASRAFPLAAVTQQSPLEDRVGDAPVLLVIGPDGKSVRAFLRRSGSRDLDLFRKAQGNDWILVDSVTGSEWNFQGCATAGPSRGQCLTAIALIKEYWFDWRNYHPATTVYLRR